MPCAFVSDYKIDSYLKLRILFLLHAQPQCSMSLDELCDQLFVADRRMLQQLVSELCQHGLLDSEGARWSGSSQPAVAYCLSCLKRAFDDPLARQRLLDQVCERDKGFVN